jgi:microcystin-dependent protein
MAPPTRYTRQFNFTNQQALTPTAPLQADKVDAELNALVVTTDQVITNLSLIQRDDGELANGSVGPEQLSAEITLGFGAPTPWEEGEAYTTTSIVTYTNKFYVASSAHTSATANRPDQISAPWTELIDLSSASIADGSVTAAKLATDAVTTAKIVDGSITTRKLVNGAIDAPLLATDAVTTAKILNANVTTAKIADANVTTAKIADANVTTAKIAANAVTTAKMAREGTAGQVLTSNGAGSDPSFQDLAAASGMPSGAIIAVAMNTAPTGYLKCNGATVSRATYAALFAAIGTTFGNGDGSTTFGLPDLRGEWIRGWADDRAVDTSRAFGSTQAEMIGPHNHTASTSGSTSSDGAHTHEVKPPVETGSGSVQFGFVAASVIATLTTQPTSSAGTHSHTISATTTVNNNSGTENRVRNIALLYCIKT